MSALFELLNDREQRTANGLQTAVVLAAVAVGAVFFFGRSGFVRARNSLDRLQQSYRQADARRMAKQTEYQKWETALRDIEAFRESYLYNEADGFNVLRLDLQAIFRQTRMSVPKISYDYAEMDEEQVKKIVAVFTFVGSYTGLKRLLTIIERFPKFLVVEQMNFTDTGSDGGSLQVKLTVVGYYGI